MKELKKAVALRYPENVEAPFICAKACGEAAKRLVKEAEVNGIPVIKDIDLADVLYMQNVGDFIPEETYEIIAKVFAFVVKIERGEA